MKPLRHIVALLVLVVSCDTNNGQTSAVDIAVVDNELAPPALRKSIIRALGAQKNAAAIPALIKTLQSPEPGIAVEALGALAAIGDVGTISALVESTHGKAPAYRNEAVAAVGRIGSSRIGNAWLFVISTGDPDESVRKRAAATLAQMETASEEKARVASDASSNRHPPHSKSVQ